MIYRIFNLRFLTLLMAFGLLLSFVGVSKATPVEVTNIIATNKSKVTIAGLVQQGWVRTEYQLVTDVFGTLDAFCVQDVLAPSGNQLPADYEILPVTHQFAPANLSAAAWIAEQFWTNPTPGFTKEDYQIAIWEIIIDGTNNPNLDIGNFRYYDGANLANIQAILGWNFGIPSDIVSWAHNPVGNYTAGGYQDYLVKHTIPTPEPATMLLLGVGLIGIAGLGRRNFLKRS